VSSSPLFQRRHYEWLARFMREQLASVSDDAPHRSSSRLMVKMLANELSRANSNFDTDRFLRACCDTVADKNAILGRAA
jgi:hypothetical protein